MSLFLKFGGMTPFLILVLTNYEDEVVMDQFISFLSAFWTRVDRQPTSKLVAACPCPDGLMQDGTQEGN
jgi:hypothetical protein